MFLNICEILMDLDKIYPRFELFKDETPIDISLFLDIHPETRLIMVPLTQEEYRLYKKLQKTHLWNKSMNLLFYCKVNPLQKIFVVKGFYNKRNESKMSNWQRFFLLLHMYSHSLHIKDTIKAYFYWRYTMF